LKQKNGGEGGIRTPGRSFGPYNGLANRRLQPLGHLSGVRIQELITSSQLLSVAVTVRVASDASSVTFWSHKCQPGPDIPNLEKRIISFERICP
jgi:hypothetical protein